MKTYTLNITLEIDAVNDRAAKRLARLVGSDIQTGRRRPGSPGASGITHAWLDAHALPALNTNGTALYDGIREGAAILAQRARVTQ